jgi:hypothetical protein
MDILTAGLASLASGSIIATVAVGKTTVFSPGQRAMQILGSGLHRWPDSLCAWHP